MAETRDYYVRRNNLKSEKSMVRVFSYMGNLGLKFSHSLSLSVCVLLCCETMTWEEVFDAEGGESV